MLLQECRRAYKKLPSEAQHRVKQMCAEILAVRTKSEAFMLALHSITGQDSPQPLPTEGEHILSWRCLLVQTLGLQNRLTTVGKFPDVK